MLHVHNEFCIRNLESIVLQKANRMKWRRFGGQRMNKKSDYVSLRFVHVFECDTLRWTTMTETHFPFSSENSRNVADIKFSEITIDSPSQTMQIRQILFSEQV